LFIIIITYIMYELRMFICYLVSITQVLKDTKAHLQELLKSRFSISQDLNFMLSLSVRINLTATERHVNLVLI
jgi:hypothetical protein